MQILRQITTKRAESCDECLHCDTCEFNNLWRSIGTSENLAHICKFAEEIIISKEKTND
jgi:hypothetical protein